MADKQFWLLAFAALYIIVVLVSTRRLKTTRFQRGTNLVLLIHTLSILLTGAAQLMSGDQQLFLEMIGRLFRLFGIPLFIMLWLMWQWEDSEAKTNPPPSK